MDSIFAHFISLDWIVSGNRKAPQNITRLSIFQDSVGSLTTQVLFVVALFFFLCRSLSAAVSVPITDLGPFPTNCTNIGDSSPCYQYMSYSGPVWDSNANRLLLWGGGHAATARDAVVQFDGTHNWTEMETPTPCSAMNDGNFDATKNAWISGAAGSYPRPKASHSYDLNVFFPAQNELVVLSQGLAMGISGCATSTSTNDFATFGKIAHYNASTRTWTFANSDRVLLSNAAEYDPVSGLAIIGGTGLMTYNAASKTLTQYINFTSTYAKDEAGNNVIGDLGYANEMVYYPPDDMFYYFDRNHHEVWRYAVNRSNFAATVVTLLNLPTSGIYPVQGINDEPGFAYDPISQRICGATTNSVISCYYPPNNSWVAIPLSSISGVTSEMHGTRYDTQNMRFLVLGETSAGNVHTYAINGSDIATAVGSSNNTLTSNTPTTNSSTPTTNPGTPTTNTGTNNTGTAAITPEQDFANRCNAAGVILCNGFESAADLGTNTLGSQFFRGNNQGPCGTSTNDCPFLDSSQHASGSNALSFRIPPGQPGGYAGWWWGNFSADKSVQFGQNSDVWVQFRYRMDTYAHDNFSWHKIGTLETGDTPTHVYYTCEALDFTIQRPENVQFPTAYQSCISTNVNISIRNASYRWSPSHVTGEYYLELAGGGNPNLAEPNNLTLSSTEISRGMMGSLATDHWSYGDNDGLGFNTIYLRINGTDPDLQPVDSIQHVKGHVAYWPFEDYLFSPGDYNLQPGRATPCLYTQYTGSAPVVTAPGCFNFTANEWLTIKVHVHLGVLSGNVYTGTTYTMWMGHEGQPLEKVIDFGPFQANAVDPSSNSGAVQTIGKYTFLPYSGNAGNVLAQLGAQFWYDELIVSTQDIADPGAGVSSYGSVAPAAPSNLVVR